MTRQSTFGWEFEVGGDVIIRKGLTPLTDPIGRVVGFTLPDGREARLVMALEVTGKGGEITVAATEQDMENLGITVCDYWQAQFCRPGE